MGLIANPAALLPQQPVQAPQTQGSGAEASRRTPVDMPFDQTLAQYKISRRHINLILGTRRELKESWGFQRRLKIRKTLKAIEYGKGNQFVVLDPYTDAYYNPFMNGGFTTSGDPLSEANLQNLYQYSHNYIQFLEGVYVSILKASIPRIEWWPGDAESDEDNRAAQAKSRASRQIGRQNNESLLLEQQLRAFFYAGSYFRHSRWSMDERVCQSVYEDVVDWQEQEIVPNRFECPSCGAASPVVIPVKQSPFCQNCGRQLTSANFFPAQSATLPVVVGKKKVPVGQVKQSIYTCLHVDLMPMATADGGSPILNTPLLDLEREIFSGALRGMFPWAWQYAKKGDFDSTTSEGETARLSRLRMYSPTIARGIVMPADLPTYHQTWFTPDCFDYLDKKEDADTFHQAFPEGFVLSTIGDQPLDIRPSALHKEWTWAGTRSDIGALPPSRVDPAMDIQDQINDNENQMQEYCDRLSCGPILYNESLVGEQLNNQHLAPGVIKGLKQAKTKEGLKLADAFYQFQAKMDQLPFKRNEELKMTIQLLSRIVPQTYGGSQKDIDTARGQEQALKVAMGVLWGDWDNIRLESAQAAMISVDCFAENSLNDSYEVTQAEDAPDFKNEPILLAELRNGNAVAYPEADQGYPIGYEQQRDLYRELVGMASGKVPNPLVMEVLNDYQNRRLAMRYLGPPDMKLPEADAVDKVLRDLTRIVSEQPQQGQDPATGAPTMVPSVMPDINFLQDYLDVAIATTVKYGLKNYRLAENNQPAFQNLTLYLKFLRFFQKVTAAQAALPPGGLPPEAAPPPGTDVPYPTMPGAAIAKQQASTKGMGPTPAPPAPVPASPMPVQ